MRPLKLGPRLIKRKGAFLSWKRTFSFNQATQKLFLPLALRLRAAGGLLVGALAGRNLAGFDTHGVGFGLHALPVSGGKFLGELGAVSGGAGSMAA